MRGLRRLGRLRSAGVAAVLLGALVPAAPAAHADTVTPVLTVGADFTGTGPSSACTKSSCPVSATSTVCQNTGVNGTGFPYANGCSASVTGTVKAKLVDKTWVCADHTGTGTFTFHDDFGASFTLGVTIAVAHGVATFTTGAWTGAGGVEIGHASGTIAPACVGQESVKQVLQGHFDYVRA
jgi:hypothetical protein